MNIISENKRILIIAYHFPPFKASSGIQRTLKYCTYLREYGWEPLILTISPTAYETTSPDQLREIPDDVVVERAFGLDTSRHLAIAGKYFRWMAQPDRWMSWWPGAVWTGMRMINRYQPKAIMSTFPISTAHRIGLSLQKRSGLPWIADFRDSMTESDYPRDPVTWRVHRKLEKEIIQHCTKAVFTTEPTRQMYADRYPEYPEAHWEVIENGFDEENFRNAELGIDPAPFSESGQFTLIHSGLLYPIERDPRPFFAALSRLKNTAQIDSNSLRIVFRATGADDLYRPMLRDMDISDIVHLAPTIGYRDALREMLRADALLLFQGSNCDHQIPAKIYEYFRAGKPILALVGPQGITASKLREAGVASIADMSDADSIATNLLALLSRLRNGDRNGVAPEVAARNSRKSRTAELADILHKVVSTGPERRP